MSLLRSLSGCCKSKNIPGLPGDQRVFLTFWSCFERRISCHQGRDSRKRSGGGGGVSSKQTLDHHPTGSDVCLRIWSFAQRQEQATAHTMCRSLSSLEQYLRCLSHSAMHFHKYSSRHFSSRLVHLTFPGKNMRGLAFLNFHLLSISATSCDLPFKDSVACDSALLQLPLQAHHPGYRIQRATVRLGSSLFESTTKY